MLINGTVGADVGSLSDSQRSMGSGNDTSPTAESKEGMPVIFDQRLAKAEQMNRRRGIPEGSKGGLRLYRPGMQFLRVQKHGSEIL